jgi:hypothetical protein
VFAKLGEFLKFDFHVFVVQLIPLLVERLNATSAAASARVEENDDDLNVVEQQAGLCLLLFLWRLKLKSILIARKLPADALLLRATLSKREPERARQILG